MIDIISIHTQIIKSIQDDYTNIDTYMKELKSAEQLLNTNITEKFKDNLTCKIKLLQKKIRDITNQETYNFYIMESLPIIQEYQKILLKPVKISFMGRSKVDNTEKHNLIIEYLKIAKKYEQIEIPNIPVLTKKCNECQEKNFQINDFSSNICLNCGKQDDVITNHSSFRDAERVNFTTRYKYDRKVHFRDCINQFQGKQNCVIPQKVYDDLVFQFEAHHLLEGDEHTPKEIRFQNIKKEHIYMFLKETYHREHYENVNLIHKHLTGAEQHDISHLENQLMHDFDLLTEVYDLKYKKNKKIERKNFINTQYVLYQLLRRHKYNCKKEDFNIIKTVDRKAFHDRICKDLFEGLGWNFTPLFT